MAFFAPQVSQGPERVRSARYGADSRWADVTQAVAQHGPKFTVSNNIFGDPAPGTVKRLDITMENGVTVSHNEGAAVHLPHESTHVRSARYGADSRWVDATAAVQKLGLRFKVDNSHFSDPAFGTAKRLELTMANGAVVSQAENGEIALGSGFIRSARYGADSRWADVSMVVGKLGPKFPVSNQHFGDPAFGTAKRLELVMDNGSTVSYPENANVQL